MLKPGGGLLTIGKDPHTDRDEWWVYDYFDETRAIDRERFARVRTLRGEMALAGFAWTESIGGRSHRGAAAGERGAGQRARRSELHVAADGAVGRGVRQGAERLRQANDDAGGELQLVADFRLYATIGWVGP